MKRAGKFTTVIMPAGLQSASFVHAVTYNYDYQNRYDEKDNITVKTYPGKQATFSARATSHCNGAVSPAVANVGGL